MESLRIQITKKMVILLSILMLFSASKCKNQDKEQNVFNISDCLELSGEFVRDTALLNEDVEFMVCFKSMCDTIISFYPQTGVLVFMKLDTIFGDNLYGINYNIKKLSSVVSLNPNETYQEIYTINLQSSYFIQGMNEFKLKYICRIEYNKKVIKPRNLLTGQLESLPIRLYLKRD